MKEGFYLSPDGLHILEIQFKLGNPMFLNIIRGIGISCYCDFILEIHKNGFEIIFSSWIYLE